MVRLLLLSNSSMQMFDDLADNTIDMITVIQHDYSIY